MPHLAYKTRLVWGRLAFGTLTAGAIALLIAGVPYQLASAHQNPSGCNSNRLNASIIKDRTEVYQGQTLTYTVTYMNVDVGSNIACDITNASVEVQLPASDGTPTGAVVSMGTGLSIPAGTTLTQAGTTQYVVNVNPGVTDIVAEVRVSGSLHDAPVDHAATIIKTIGTSVVTPPAASAAAAGAGAGASGAATTPRLPRTGTAPAR